MILTHGANSLAKGDFVEIGGRKYKTVTIGNQIWTAENLDWKFEGITLNQDSGGWDGYSAWYYNNDEATYGLDGTYKCGLLYTQMSAIYIDSLLTDGWRVPTTTDFQTLIDNFSASSLLAEASSITSGFPNSSWGGNNELGLSLLPTGKRQDYTFKDFNPPGVNYDAVNLWSKTISGNFGSYLQAYNLNLTISGSTGRNQGLPIHLCRDIT